MHGGGGPAERIRPRGALSLETYGRYQLLKKLATGGMAQIYLARQLGPEGFEKLLVVKRILPHLAENDDFITMFLDEARIAARLNHPNIVQIFDLGAQDDSFFIAMEYIHGEDVRRVWKQAEKMGQPIPTALICRIIIEACAGLDYAHKKTDPSGRPLNIVHRDISPQNILVSFEGGVKIVDFGIAKAADQATVTRSGVLKGKYSYMSPEQAGGQTIDSRTDVFALGVVLYELLTGARLFKRTTDIQTLNAVTECKVAPPSEIDHRVPRALDAIVMKALAKDRTQRYAEARQLGADLEAWLLSEGLPSSSAHLAEFLKRIYADRLAREQEEGRLLIESADASLADEPEKATPSQASGDGRATRTGKSAAATRSRREAEPTTAERPPSRSGPISKPRSMPSVPPALGAEPPMPTDQSLPTQNDSRGGRRAALVAVAAVFLAAVAGIVWWAFGGGNPPTVQLASTPPGAEVFEGGQALCTTPCALTTLAPGTHQLELRAPGRESAHVTVEVPAHGEAVVPPVTLAEARAPEVGDAGVVGVAARKVALVVDSEPAGATVRLGEEVVGTTPWRGEAEAGARLTLQLELAGHVSQTESFTVGDGPEETHRLTLPTEKVVKVVRPPVVRPKDPPEVTKATGTVRFVVRPTTTYATVECGPYKFGDTPFPDKQLPVGEYRCTFTNPDLGQKTAQVKVEPNALVKVSISFQ